MRYPHHEGVGDRIKKRLLELGFEKDGAPDYGRFIRTYGYDGRYFYPWINKGRTPAGENLKRLAADLRVSEGWLLVGDAGLLVSANPRRTLASLVLLALAATAYGVPASAGTPQVVDSKDELRLIGSRRRFWVTQAA